MEHPHLDSQTTYKAETFIHKDLACAERIVTSSAVLPLVPAEGDFVCCGTHGSLLLPRECKALFHHSLVVGDTPPDTPGREAQISICLEVKECHCTHLAYAG